MNQTNTPPCICKNVGRCVRGREWFNNLSAEQKIAAIQSELAKVVDEDLMELLGFEPETELELGDDIEGEANWSHEDLFILWESIQEALHDDDEISCTPSSLDVATTGNSTLILSNSNEQSYNCEKKVTDTPPKNGIMGVLMWCMSNLEHRGSQKDE